MQIQSAWPLRKFCHHYLLHQKQKGFLKIHFEFVYFSFLLIQIEMVNIFLHSLKLSRKPYPISDQHGQSLNPFLDQNGTTAHTCMAYLLEYPSRTNGKKSQVDRCKQGNILTITQKENTLKTIPAKVYSIFAINCRERFFGRYSFCLTLMADGADVNLVFSSGQILRDLRTIKDVFCKNGNQF